MKRGEHLSVQQMPRKNRPKNLCYCFVISPEYLLSQSGRGIWHHPWEKGFWKGLDQVPLDSAV